MRTRGCVARFAGGFTFALLLALLTPMTGLGGYWLPGSYPAGGEIVHETALTPPDPSRTTIGIGEVVNLSVTSYYDVDTWVDDNGFQWEYQDSMGVAEWSLSGPGTLRYSWGDTNFYTAPLSTYNTCVYIEVSVPDSGTQYVAPVLYDGVPFDILVPNGVASLLWGDYPIWADAPPVNSMGAHSNFAFQAFPDTVNFGNVYFREVIPSQVFEWPDGTYYFVDEFTKIYRVFELYGGPNWQTDDVHTGGPWIIDHLELAGSDPPVYQGCQFDVMQHLQYECESGWVTFSIVAHPSNFSGTTFATQVGWGGTWGGPQGPYQ